jgi:hypothetical protein
MRIKANQLPQVTEKDGDSSDDDNIKGICPLEIGNCSLAFGDLIKFLDLWMC